MEIIPQATLHQTTETQMFISSWTFDPQARRTSCWARESTGRVFAGWRAPREGEPCPLNHVNTVPARGLSNSRILSFCWSKNLKRLSAVPALGISPPFSSRGRGPWSTHPRLQRGCSPAGNISASSACEHSTGCDWEPCIPGWSRRPSPGRTRWAGSACASGGGCKRPGCSPTAPALWGLWGWAAAWCQGSSGGCVWGLCWRWSRLASSLPSAGRGRRRASGWDTKASPSESDSPSRRSAPRSERLPLHCAGWASLSAPVSPPFSRQ